MLILGFLFAQGAGGGVKKNIYDPCHEKTCFKLYAMQQRCRLACTSPCFNVSRLACQFESYLVMKPEDRFSCNVAHVMMCLLTGGKKTYLYTG